MATVPNNLCNGLPNSRDDSVPMTLARLEAQLGAGAKRASDADDYEALGSELGHLHALIRLHHPAGMRAASMSADEMPPEFSSDLDRLLSEHTTILGLLDRIIRTVSSMADRPIEDKEVFFLRVHELVAIVRRHEAEEDRLFYLAVWRDVGGES